MRLLVMGHTENRGDIIGPTDSPVASMDSIRMLYFSGDLSENEESIAICDVQNAFRQSLPYDPAAPKRYVCYKSHKNGTLRVFQLLGSLYGQVDGSMRFYETMHKYLTDEGFVRGDNDYCIYMHPETKIRLALHVDDYLVRGERDKLEQFFAKMCENSIEVANVFLKKMILWESVDCFERSSKSFRNL